MKTIVSDMTDVGCRILLTTKPTELTACKTLGNVIPVCTNGEVWWPLVGFGLFRCFSVVKINVDKRALGTTRNGSLEDWFGTLATSKVQSRALEPQPRRAWRAHITLMILS